MKHTWWRASLAGLCVVFLMTGTAHADVNDFVITSFDADYTLTKADAQGQLAVTETIDVDFHDQNHGILRALPNRYKKHQLQLDVKNVTIDAAAGQWTTYQSNGNTVFKIGDPARTITGKHRYVIDYTVRNVISFYDNHDELYWDINGDQWGQAAQAVSVTLKLPGEATLGTHRPICYTGAFGGTARACTIQYDPKDNTVQAATTQALVSYQTLSVVVGFEKGYFTPSAWHETAAEYAAAALKFLTPLLLIGGTAGWYWFRYGRDPKGRGVIVPEYEAPDHLKPIEAGTIADFKTDNRDITATIIDLAIRGYLRIIEQIQVRKFRKDIKTFSLRLEKTDFDGLLPFEATLLKNIFDKQLLTNHPEGAEVALDALKYKLAGTAAGVRDMVRDRLTAHGYFRKHPLSMALRLAGLLFGAFLISLVLAMVGGGAAALGIAAGVVVAVIFILLLPSRTPKGVAAKESILGLKLYLETAEAERLKKLQSPDAPYAPKSPEPKQTVALFEKLLPYAMVLGVEQQWAVQFEHIYRTPPDWYQGNWTTFSVIYLASSIGGGISSGVNAAFSAPSSSSSSGFSGGGAGGGGGGGGGGGW